MLLLLQHQMAEKTLSRREWQMMDILYRRGAAGPAQLLGGARQAAAQRRDRQAADRRRVPIRYDAPSVMQDHIGVERGKEYGFALAQ